jgi:hypothetical protein
MRWLIGFFLLLILVAKFRSDHKAGGDTLKATIEASAGPFAQIARNITGVGRLSAGEYLVSLRELGLFRFSKKDGWTTVSGITGKITGLSETAPGEVAVSTESGHLFLFRDSSTNVHETAAGTPFRRIARCGTQLIGAADDRLYEIIAAHAGTVPFAMNPVQPRGFDCHDGKILLGTDGSGLIECSLSERTCAPAADQLPSNHIEAVLWNTQRKTWWAGLYGDADFSVMERTSEGWKPVGGHIGDVMVFAAAPGGSPHVLTESGFLFDFHDGFLRRPLGLPMTASALSLDKDTIVGGSDQKLVEVRGNDVATLGNPVRVDPDSGQARLGNSYVWDIVSLPESVAYASTGQSGVWWSTNAGRTWKQISDGLTDPKIHFIAYDPELRKLMAGGHSRGLFVCALPCQQWKKIADDRFTDADLESIVPLNHPLYLVSSEHGAFVWNADSEKVEHFLPLTGKENNGSADLWTAKLVDGRVLLGIYAKKNRPTGIWQLLEGDFDKVADLPYPVTGIEYIDKVLFAGTTDGLYRCHPDCKKVLSEPVNRMLYDGGYLWLATPHGAGRIRPSEKPAPPQWLVKFPAQTIKKAAGEPNVFLVGGTDRGVVRVRLDE